MILNIETTKREQIILGLFDDNVLKCFEFETEGQPALTRVRRGMSEDLLAAIDGILKKNNFELKDLEAILVNCGPGSFTGVRVGVTVANTLGWSLSIPVVGYRDGELEKYLSRNITKGEFSKPVLPFYS